MSITDMNAHVRGIIEGAILQLGPVGMERRHAIELLAFQYIIRLRVLRDDEALLHPRDEIDRFVLPASDEVVH